jgi:hypothetical protein
VDDNRHTQLARHVKAFCGAGIVRINAVQVRVQLDGDKAKVANAAPDFAAVVLFKMAGVHVHNAPNLTGVRLREAVDAVVPLNVVGLGLDKRVNHHPGQAIAFHVGKQLLFCVIAVQNMRGTQVNMGIDDFHNRPPFPNPMSLL